MTFTRGGQELASFALISHRDGWSFKLRTTGPKSDAQALAALSGAMFAQGLPKD